MVFKKITKFNISFFLIFIVFQFFVNAQVTDSAYLYTDTTKLLNKNTIDIADSIFLFDGSVILVDVKNFTLKNIIYSDPGEMDLYKIDRRKVYKIIYKSGLVEILNSIEKEIPDSKDWKNILVTENPSEVENYIKVGKVKGNSNNSLADADDEALERSALIIIKKQAIKLEADIILITNKQVYRGYGETPMMSMKGIAYKF